MNAAIPKIQMLRVYTKDGVVMNSHVPLLIVGAGPTGLLLACELARHGVTFKIIDKKMGRTVASMLPGYKLELLNYLIK